MHLELLANELLLEVFEFLDGFHLIRAFYGLNSRLNQLLSVHFRAYRFDFRSISKDNFDYICQNYLPSITDRTISICISDDDETPNLPQALLSHELTLDKFTHLRYLSLYSIQSFDLLSQLISQCSRLSFLTHLLLVDGYKDNRKNNVQFLIDTIWSLPMLSFLYINYNSSSKIWFSKISVVQSSIRKLYIPNITCSLSHLTKLMQCTPSLEHLNTTVHFDLQDEDVPPLQTRIKSLKLAFESSTSIMVRLFQMMPNLYSLTLKTMDIYFNGKKWKNILKTYLPQLKVFHLRMYFEFLHNKSISDQLRELLRSFQKSFWTVEHRWFIQCDCIPFGSYFHGILYTLPYAFDTFFSYDTLQSIWTCPNENSYWSHKKVQCLQYMRYKVDSVNPSNQIPIQFLNVQQLKLALACDDGFWSCVPSLDRLKTLEIILGDSYDIHQLQRLFDLAPHLYSLRVLYSMDSKMLPGQIICPSMRCLNLISKCTSNIIYFQSDECASLAYSQLGRQCEVLSIQIENRSNVLDLIRALSNLRSLVFRCQDDKWSTEDLPIANDELVEWLRAHLSSTCSISRDSMETSNIRIWISRRFN